MNKLLFLTGFFTTIIFSTLKGQEIKSVELCNNTKSLLYFDEASMDIQRFLLRGDTLFLSTINFSVKNKPTTKYLLSLSKQFNGAVGKYKLLEIPASNFTKSKIDGTLWNEANYFYIDKKTSKAVQILQVVVYFEGTNADDEAKNPIVKKVVLRTGKQIINRSKYLKDAQPEEIPPMQEKM